jgi:hypothetical protein
MTDKEPVQLNEAWTAIQRNGRGEVIGKSSGLNFDRLANNLKIIADNMDHIQKAKQIINKACEENNGLPF